MNDEPARGPAAANQHGKVPALEPDPKLVALADRAVAAGMSAAWYAFKGFKSGMPEGSPWLRIELPAGQRSRHMDVRAEGADAVAATQFEKWVALGEYQAILDTEKKVIIAEVSVGVFPFFRKLPGVVTKNVTAEAVPEQANSAGMTQAFVTSLKLDQVSYLSVPAPNNDLSLELRSSKPPEIAALTGFGGQIGYALVIHGVATKHHDDAIGLLVDLANSFFIDLDITYGLKANLKKDYDAELVVHDGYDDDRPGTISLRFPSVLHNRDAASLYLYARRLRDMPLVEYLAYYQVIEFYLPTYARSATIVRLRNILKDPSFDYNNDVTMGRLLDSIAPTGRKIMGEREQVATAISYCVDDAAIAAFLADMPAAAKALADKNRIQNVQVISAHNQQTSLTSQVARRIYDLRCRIVHGKDGDNDGSPPIRPFERESFLMRHDLSLIRFIARRILIASSRPAAW